MNTNKGIYLLMAIAVLFLLPACNKNKTANYTVALQVPAAVFAIPSSYDTSDLLPYGTAYIPYNLDSAVKSLTKNSLGMADIKTVHLRSCVLTLQNATPADNFHSFSTLSAGFATNAVSAYYTATDNSTKDSISYTLNMPVDSTADLSGYFISNQFRYSLSGKQRDSTATTLLCSTQFTFVINARN